MNAIESQSAFMRGFIDDELREAVRAFFYGESQSAFMRGFIDDPAGRRANTSRRSASLNPRSCAASSMTEDGAGPALA